MPIYTPVNVTTYIVIYLAECTFRKKGKTEIKHNYLSKRRARVVQLEHLNALLYDLGNKNKFVIYVQCSNVTYTHTINVSYFKQSHHWRHFNICFSSFSQISSLDTEGFTHCIVKGS